MRLSFGIALDGRPNRSAQQSCLDQVARNRAPPQCQTHPLEGPVPSAQRGSELRVRFRLVSRLVRSSTTFIQYALALDAAEGPLGSIRRRRLGRSAPRRGCSQDARDNTASSSFLQLAHTQKSRARE